MMSPLQKSMRNRLLPCHQDMRLPSVGAELTAGMSRPVTSRSWAPEEEQDSIIVIQFFNYLNLPKSYPSLFFFGLLSPLWCSAISASYYLLVLIDFKVITYIKKYDFSVSARKFYLRAKVVPEDLF